jgi:dTMP kinase
MSELRREARLLTIEGGEGVGKSTVLRALREALAADGEEVVCTREPGGTPLAERIRALLLDPTHEPAAPDTELLLMFAARAQHVRQLVVPALGRGAWVISDRFTDSSYAYQGAARGLDAGFVAELERRVVGIEPGLTLLLDLGVGHGRERARGRELLAGAAPDRIERERRYESALTGEPLVDTGLLASAAPSGARRPMSSGCAATPEQLARDLQASMAMGDVNRMAESFDWAGMQHASAMQVMARLERLGVQALVDAEYFDATIGIGAVDAAASGVMQVVLDDAGARTVADFDVRRSSGCYFLRYA